MKPISFLAAAVTAALLSTTAFSADAKPNLLAVWGGAKQGASEYTDVYVPHLIDALNSAALSGYQWGGPSSGTIDNAGKVTVTPTNLAIGQYDLLKDLNGKPMPNGKPYAFTILNQDLGPECLYLVTNMPGYNTFGDFLGNAFQINIATGSELSGSYGTFEKLASLYPDIQQMNVDKVGDIPSIIDAVKSGKDTHGFFVMRPDPQSKTFQMIKDANLTVIPVVDYGLQDDYKFLNLKIANGGLFGIGGSAKSVTTACTSVALITGDPKSEESQALSPRDQKRLSVTIQRISALSSDSLKPDISSWADMWDNLTAVTQDEAKAAMDASKKALDDIIKKQGK